MVRVDVDGPLCHWPQTSQVFSGLRGSAIARVIQAPVHVDSRVRGILQNMDDGAQGRCFPHDGAVRLLGHDTRGQLQAVRLEIAHDAPRDPFAAKQFEYVPKPLPHLHVGIEFPLSFGSTHIPGRQWKDEAPLARFVPPALIQAGPQRKQLRLR